MWHRQLKIALCSIAIITCTCSYQYQTIRCVKTITLPKSEQDTITVTVTFIAYMAYIQDNRSDISRTNNDAVNYVVKGNVDNALTLFQSIIASNEPAVLNNYGVALILKGDFNTGCDYIYKAAILQPNNSFFRKNYLYLHELKH